MKLAFRGVWSANNFAPFPTWGNHFQIVNTSNANQLGSHWILLVALEVVVAVSPTAGESSRERNKGVSKGRRRRGGGQRRLQQRKTKQLILVWNSLQLPTTYYTNLYNRLLKLYNKNKHYSIQDIQQWPPVQSFSSVSNLCGLYCIYASLCIFHEIGQEAIEDDDESNAKQRLLGALNSLYVIDKLSIVRFFNHFSINTICKYIVE